MPLHHVLHTFHLYSSWLDWLALAQEIALALVQFLLHVLAITVGALAESVGNVLPAPAPEFQDERVQNPCACPHCAAAAWSRPREVMSVSPEESQYWADLLARTLAASAAAELAAASSDAATPLLSRARQSGPYFIRPTAGTLAAEAVQAAQAAQAPMSGSTVNPAVGGPLLPDLDSD